MSSLLQSVARSLRPSNLTATTSSLSVATRWQANSGLSSRPYSADPSTIRHGKLPRRNWSPATSSTPLSLLDDDSPVLGPSSRQNRFSQLTKPVDQEWEPSEEGEDDESTTQRVGVHTRSRFSQNETPSVWASHRSTMLEKFPEGWQPPRKLSRDAMDGLRSLHAHDPETFSTPFLSAKFKISPEAVRRILKSKWVPTKEKREKLLERERRMRQERIVKAREEEKMGYELQKQKRRTEWEATRSSSENGEHKDLDVDEELDQADGVGARESSRGDFGYQDRNRRRYTGSRPPRGLDREDRLTLT